MTKLDIAPLSPDAAGDVQAVARYIAAHVNEHWQTLLAKNDAKLQDAYQRAGDQAYGTYLDLVFRPIHMQLRQAGLKPRPRLPGKFDISREWGNADQTDQQRWMWSTLQTLDGEALGTLVTITYHDHTRFHVPRAPGIFGLAAVGKEAVIEALSAQSANFQQAREASIEIAEYLAGAEGQTHTP